MSTRSRKVTYDDEKMQRARESSRDNSPSSTQIPMDTNSAPTSTTRGKSYRKDIKPSHGAVPCNKSHSRESSTSSEDTDDEKKRSKHRSHSRDRYDKTKVSSHKPSSNKRDHDTATTSSRTQRRSPENVPYFADVKREEERLRRKYGPTSSSRSIRRSSSRDRRRSRTRRYSRERHRSRYRSSSRDRRRSSSYDRYRSRRRSRSPARHHERSSMMSQGPSPPYIPILPFHYPFPPNFMPAPYGPPRFPPDGVMRPQFPPPMVLYVPQPIIRPMGRWINRPPRPRRNQ